MDSDETMPVLTRDPIVEMLLAGEAQTASEAEELYLDRHLPDILKLVESSLSDQDFRAHPLIMLLFAHGSRGWEDSLA